MLVLLLGWCYLFLFLLFAARYNLGNDFSYGSSTGTIHHHVHCVLVVVIRHEASAQDRVGDTPAGLQVGEILSDDSCRGKQMVRRGLSATSFLELGRAAAAAEGVVVHGAVLGVWNLQESLQKQQ